MMKFMIAGIAAVTSLIGPAALAADLPLKAPPPVVMPCIWCGAYIGINGGGGWENTTWNYPTVGFFDTVAGQGFRTNPSGALVGGQIGYNWQLGGPLVIGAEFKGDWANLRQTLLGPVTPVYPFDSYKTELRDLESLTLRVGYGPANWLFYGKAGVATGTERLSVVSGAPVAGVVYSNSYRGWGPTAGVGLEYLVRPNLTIGVEYDYASLSSTSINTTGVCNGAPTCTGSAPAVLVNSSTFGVSTVVGRLNYKFNLGAPGRY